MARKRKSSGLEDARRVVALLPWWAGVALALLSYGLLHLLAQPPLAKSMPSGQVGAFAAGVLLSAFAMAGQFLIPLVCLFGALASFLARRRRQALLRKLSQGKASDAIDGMSWREFEMLVAEGFRGQGYRVTEVGGSGPDGGIDLILSQGSEKLLVQCKHWKALKVGVSVVRELYGVMAASGAAGGFVVTSGRFTQDAAAFAKGLNIELIDGRQLGGLLGQASAAGEADDPAPSRPSARPAPRRAPAQRATAACPSCGASMAKRKAGRGADAGNQFSTCAAYPKCEGARNS